MSTSPNHKAKSDQKHWFCNYCATRKSPTLIWVPYMCTPLLLKNHLAMGLIITALIIMIMAECWLIPCTHWYLSISLPGPRWYLSLAPCASIHTVHCIVLSANQGHCRPKWSGRNDESSLSLTTWLGKNLYSEVSTRYSTPLSSLRRTASSRNVRRLSFYQVKLSRKRIFIISCLQEQLRNLYNHITCLQ